MPQDAPDTDLFGATHIGRVRSNNQDHFLAASLGDETASATDPVTRVWGTSLPSLPAEWRAAEVDDRPARSDPLIAAVADGVGGGPGGEPASRFALLHLPDQLRAALVEGGNAESGATSAPTSADPASAADDDLNTRLVHAVLGVHSRVTQQGRDELGLDGMATTLTIWLGHGAHAHLLQVGDSRCYRLRDGQLEILSRDQTMAQDMVDRGVLESVDLAPPGWDNILTSAVGGTAAAPAVVSLDRRPGDCVLVCSDGIMKHIADEELAEVLGLQKTAREKVEQLIQRALDGGGSDNITALVVQDAAGREER